MLWAYYTSTERSSSWKMSSGTPEFFRLFALATNACTNNETLLGQYYNYITHIEKDHGGYAHINLSKHNTDINSTEQFSIDVTCSYFLSFLCIFLCRCGCQLPVGSVSCTVLHVRWSGCCDSLKYAPKAGNERFCLQIKRALHKQNIII